MQKQGHECNILSDCLPLEWNTKARYPTALFFNENSVKGLLSCKSQASFLGYLIDRKSVAVLSERVKSRQKWEGESESFLIVYIQLTGPSNEIGCSLCRVDIWNTSTSLASFPLSVLYPSIQLLSQYLTWNLSVTWDFNPSLSNWPETSIPLLVLDLISIHLLALD